MYVMINETNSENGVNGTQTYGEGSSPGTVTGGQQWATGGNWGTAVGNWGTAASTKPSTNYCTEEG